MSDDMVQIPLHALNALHEDALRYRWLRQWAQARSIHMDGSAEWRLIPPILRGRYASFDAAIDTEIARAQSEEHTDVPPAEPTH